MVTQDLESIEQALKQSLMRDAQTLASGYLENLSECRELALSQPLRISHQRSIVQEPASVD